MRSFTSVGQSIQLKRTLLITTLKVAVIGGISGQLLLALAKTAHVLISRSAETYSFRLCLLVIYSALAVLLPLGVLVASRRSLTRILESRRVDLLFVFVAGCLTSLWFPAASEKWELVLAQSTNGQITMVSVLLCVLAGAIVGRVVFAACENPPAHGVALFISDDEKISVDDDLLNVRENAERFARRVLNGGAKDSMVFGLDAPWGAGKSSFINFCAEFWRNSYGDKVIVYRFNPLQYEDRVHLLGKFVDGLVLTIKDAVFRPELNTVMSQYADLIKAEKKFSLWGVEWTVSKPTLTIERATEELREVLAALSHRLIIIVDDLDRMEFTAVKDILFVIKKAFALPNISFVLCYDTQNIAALESPLGGDKISEFLEKFVNLKTGLFLSSEALKKFVTESRKIASSRNPLSDVRLLDDVLGGLSRIFESEDYYRYLPLIGDARKIKRLLNVLVLLDIGQTDFKNSDFDTEDLIHLLLIYLNYPTLFRQIYNAETDGRFGLFSVVRAHTKDGVKYLNSPEYFLLTKKLEDGGRVSELLLLERLFDIEKRLKKKPFREIPEEAKRSLACFNDPAFGQANLSAYLDLIVSASPNRPEASYRRFVNLKNQVIAGLKIEKVFDFPVFSPEHGERSYEEFWRVISNSLEEFNAEKGSGLIRYILQNIPRHSAIELRDPYLGFRFSSGIYFLLKLVDTLGWKDEDGWHRNNVDANLVGISDWIYGEGEHASEGILSTLMAPKRGALGLRDVLMFRLYCCADRDGALFNLTRAVGLHSDPSAPTAGLVSEIVKPQMRKLSQTVFGEFKKQYIDPGRNIFYEFDALPLGKLLGDFVPAIDVATEKNLVSKADVDRVASATRITLRNFCLYQLSNKIVQSGVGCGYYDEVGAADGAGISNAMNDYLFGLCFLGASPEGRTYFVNFLLSNLTSVFGLTARRHFVPRLEAFCLVLDRGRLKNYWTAYGETIKGEFVGRDGVIPTSGYVASYMEDLEPLFAELDKLLADDTGAPLEEDLLSD